MTRWFDNEHQSLRRFWHPVAIEADLVDEGPHSVTLLGERWALWRGREGWAMVPDRCPHRLAPLTAGCVDDGVLQCGYHGWRFGADGRCVEIPALGVGAAVPPAAHLAAAHVAVRYGLVWVSLEDPLRPIPDVPEYDDPSLGKAPMPAQRWSAGAAQMTDNFLDVAHFPFTHLGTIGNPDEIEVGDIEIDRDGLMFDATYGHTARSIEQASAGAADVAVVERVMRFRCWAPHHLRLAIDYGPDGRLVLLFFHQPIDVETTGLYCIILAENIVTGAMTAEEQIAFQFEVGREDREMLEQLATKGVALDPGAEVHTRADRTTLELRRMLAAVVDTAG